MFAKGSPVLSDHVAASIHGLIGINIYHHHGFPLDIILFHACSMKQKNHSCSMLDFVSGN